MFSDYTTSLPILEIALLVMCMLSVASHTLHVCGWLKEVSPMVGLVQTNKAVEVTIF